MIDCSRLWPISSYSFKRARSEMALAAATRAGVRSGSRRCARTYGSDRSTSIRSRGPKSKTVIRAWIASGFSNDAMLDEQLALTVAWNASARSPAGRSPVSSTSMLPPSVGSKPNAGPTGRGGL